MGNDDLKALYSELGLQESNSGAYSINVYSSPNARILSSYSPIDNRCLGNVCVASERDYEEVMRCASITFENWRQVPAPVRGQVIREIGEELRKKKGALGRLITWEMGKIVAEGEGEVQEAIDIADFAVGLSRQLYGKAMHSERAGHRMFEQWHPLGIVGVITAFNYPVAVWAWNAFLAAVCGDVVVWKPSELVPLTSVAVNSICREVAARHGFPGLFSLVIGDGPELGKRIAADPRIPLVSATGSCAMGRDVASVVGRRLGKSLLELGGNNSVTVLRDADLKLAIPSTVFGAVGTAGQRCTTTRRILIERPIYERFVRYLVGAYAQVTIGSPLDSKTIMGPLINQHAVEQYRAALEQIKAQGGEILYGGEVVANMPSGLYVRPTIVRAHPKMKIVQEETFAPIVYLFEVRGIKEAIALNNSVAQGLSSAVFTRSSKKAELFLSAAGSDCGIANVNTGTSQAEVGGAFGGEKDTGGGREAGSDSWQAYMRRQTSTINYNNELLLAQGVRFALTHSGV